MQRLQGRRMLAIYALILLILSSATFGSRKTRAQEIQPEALGALDPNFGSGGKVVTDFFGGAAFPEAMAVQSDGKIIVAGVAFAGASDDTSDFAVARYNSDGSPDSTFGVGGKTTTDFFHRSDQAFSIALQQDGKIVVVGQTSTGAKTIVAAVRYNSNGSLDGGFGASGKVTLDFGGAFEVGVAAAVQSDGHIVIAGYESNSDPGSFIFILARLDATGVVDASFGSGGMAIGPSIALRNLAAAVALQADGKVVVSGSSGTSNTITDFALMRYKANGSLNTTFGTNGSTTTDFFGLQDVCRSLFVLADGKLLGAGSATVAPNNTNFALVRYNADGSLDSGFGSGGKVNTAFTEGISSGMRAALQSDGKIVVVGRVAKSADVHSSDVALARYNSDGSLDATFGTAGRTVTDLFGFFDQAMAVAIQPDNNIVVAADSYHSQDGATQDFVVLRYVGASSFFTIGVDQPAVTADRGTTVKIKILINRPPGLTGDVTVKAPDSIEGVKIKGGDSISSEDSSVTFKLKIKPAAAIGPRQLTFNGRTNGGQASTVTVTLNIQ